MGTSFEEEIESLKKDFEERFLKIEKEIADAAMKLMEHVHSIAQENFKATKKINDAMIALRSAFREIIFRLEGVAKYGKDDSHYNE